MTDTNSVPLPKNDDDMNQYARRHLLEHMYAAGYTDSQIESLIFNLPYYDLNRAHFAEQYIARLPKDLRKAARLRLEPELDV